MGNLDDGPEQVPIPLEQVEATILSLLPRLDFDILLTHAPQGEYTWHRRHGEVSRAIQELWRYGRLRVRCLWEFAYEDGGGAYAPRPRQDASVLLDLPGPVWARKQALITDVYGFTKTSWEARAATRAEAFNCYRDPAAIPLVAGEDLELSR